MNPSSSWLKVEELLGGSRPAFTGDANDMRSQLIGLSKSLAPLFPPESNGVVTKDGTYEGIRYRVYTPSIINDATIGKLPCGVYFHGGGFVLGDLDMDDPICRALCEGTHAVIISVGYRLAPEHKAPTQLRDSLEFFEWVYHSAKNLGTCQEKLFTIGTSAGGALAFTVARKVALGHASLPKNAAKGVVAFNPVTVHPDNIPKYCMSQHTSFEENKENTPILNLKTLLEFFTLTQISPNDSDYFVGLDQESHGLLPPSYIVTCEWDPLRDDGKVLADSMELLGVNVKRDHWNGMPHCFWLFPMVPEYTEFMEMAYKGFKWVIEQA
ncbi:putative sterigmatocystin biosynthesis lipase/esterase stci [Fusarium sporotrichioides]|uniref:Putative sterigmatocystin biosynthesis lipase/esterase stci n=1 Tax=Fusarium sporotrichioides TaxID=5514 RepID=A0A395RLB2_FUSSP|nr:putative sterigmatocystin biosynthesis lipase/esterase stci [Fusarium sporotrichioides]